MIFETERLVFREMVQDDFADLAEMLQDPQVMYAYEHDFSDLDVQQWLDRQIRRYRDYGFGLWAVITKAGGIMVGQAGLTMQPYRNTEVLEIVKEKFWHNGYALEAAKSLAKYAFDKLNLQEIILEIRPENTASRKVAERLNAHITGSFTKNVKGKEMYHLIYTLHK